MTSIQDVFRRLHRDVDVVAGGETQVEIVMPETRGTIRIHGEFKNALLIEQIDAHTTFRDQAYGFTDAAGRWGADFDRLPFGLAQIVVSRNLAASSFADTPDGFRSVWEHHWVEVGSEPVSLELQELRAGRLMASLRGASEAPITQFTLRAAPLYDGLPEEVRNRLSADQIQSTGAFIESEVGVLYLAPGRYEVSITAMGKTVFREVEIVEGETVEIDAELEAASPE
jgi:hypothetical protein